MTGRLLKYIMLPMFFLGMITSLSCGRIDGEFAVKRSQDEVYHRITKPLEFSSDEEAKWAFVTKKTRKRRDLGIAVLKKELGWIEVKTWSDYIDIEKPVIHGEIRDYPPGDYRIMILDFKRNNRIVGTIDFLVYPLQED